MSLLPFLIPHPSSCQSYVYNHADCYSYNLNHVVLAVGYCVQSQCRGFPGPFWILRNSWGTGWGDRGFMRMGISGGDGICGINVLPGLYPVIKSEGLSEQASV